LYSGCESWGNSLLALLSHINVEGSRNELSEGQHFAASITWDFHFNYEKHYLGRVWVCWKKKDYRVSVVDKSDQSISGFFYSNHEKVSWFQTFVYSANNPIDRRGLWQSPIHEIEGGF